MMTENIAEIIQKIETYNGVFPREELQILIDHPAESAPFLLEALTDTEKLYQRLEAEEDYILPFYALFLLAQFRETKAYPPVCEIFSFEAETVNHLWGDLITEDLGRILASVCGGDVSLINQLIESDDVYQFVRSAAMDSWLCLLRAKQKTRQEVTNYYQTLFDSFDEDDYFIRTSLIANCLDLRAEEFLPKIEQDFNDDLVDLSIMGDWDEFQSLWHDENYRLFDDETNKHYDLVEDTITDLNSWHYFQSEEEREKSDEKFMEGLKKLSSLLSEKKTSEKKTNNSHWNRTQITTFQRETPKVGKNEPCPCGSGRKYKKCCLN